MGTRHLIAVVKNSEYKVAQYCQWDGYPEGAGSDILSFLHEKDAVKSLIENLSKVRFFDSEGRDKQFIEDYSKNAPEWSSDPDKRTDEQKRWFRSYISRDLSSEILWNIANSTDEEILLKNSIEFVGESQCEWAYIIDFDKNCFEVYEGYSEEPLKEGDRFFGIKAGKYCVKLVKVYSLDDLPCKSDFLDDLTHADEE